MATRRHHRRHHKNFSACTHFSKTRKLCTEPCKYVFRQLKDANTGMMKTVGFCKTKYNHFKKHGKKTKHHRRVLKKMSKDIQKLEKATVVAKKANDDVSKIGMNMEIPVPSVPSVADISKTVGNLFSSVTGTSEKPATEKPATEESTPATEESVPVTEEPVPAPAEESATEEPKEVVKGGK